MPHLHYMMDCYYLDHTKADQVRRESNAIKAGGDTEAISEAKLAAIWKKPIWFEVRKVERTGDQAIYSSKDKS